MILTYIVVGPTETGKTIKGLLAISVGQLPCSLHFFQRIFSSQDAEGRMDTHTYSKQVTADTFHFTRMT